MAGAEWLSQGTTDWPAVAGMAVGTLAGAALPGVPLLFLAGTAGFVGSAILAVFVTLMVAKVRAAENRKPLLLSTVQTVLVLLVGVLTGYGAALLL